MTVVVGYTATREGEAALEAGLSQLADPDETLLVVVSRPVTPQDQTAQHEADAVRDRLDAADLAHEVRQVPAGADVGEHLVALCVERDARLLVFGLRRRRPEAHLELGAHARRILLDVPCPVLVVKSCDPDT